MKEEAEWTEQPVRVNRHGERAEFVCVFNEHANVRDSLAPGAFAALFADNDISRGIVICKTVTAERVLHLYLLRLYL